MTSRFRNASSKKGRSALAGLLLFMAAHPFASEAARFRVDEVEIEGARSFTRSEIEAELELSLIEDLDADQVEEIGLNLREFYRFRGYDAAGVKGELVRVPDGASKAPKNVLRINVNEGLPTRVNDTRFFPENLRDESLRETWNQIEGALAARAGILPGMVADQQKLSDARQAIESHVAAEGFVGVRVSSIRFLSSTQPRKDLRESLGSQTARWIDVEISIDLGEKVTFGFRGNTLFTQLDLMKFVEEQRLVGFGKNYIDSIAARFLEEYRARGYAHAAVEAFPVEKPGKQERHVTYLIHEGPLVRTESIEFEGNEIFSDDEILKRFYKLAPPLVRNGVYSSVAIDQTLELLIEKLKSEGYLSARLVAVSHDARKGKNRARVTVYLFEGVQTILRSVGYTGIDHFKREEVLEMLGLVEGQGLNLFALSEGIERMKARYKMAAFLDNKLLNENEGSILRYTPDGLFADIELQYSEGPRYKLDSVSIEGLSQTRENVVARALRIDPEDYLEQDALDDTTSALRRLGLFSTIELKVENSPKPAYKRVRVLLQEAYPGVIGGGFGFRNDLGPRVFSEVAFNNLWKSNHTVSLTGAINRRFEDYHFLEYETQAAYVWPYIFSDVQFRPEVNFDKKQYRSFSAQTLGFTTALSKQLLRRTRLVATFAHTLERVRQFSAVSGVDNQTLTIGSLTPGLSLDLRDNPLAPRRGFYSSATYEIAHTSFGSQTEPFDVGFTRFQWRNDYHWELAEYMILYFSFRTGIEQNLVNPIRPDGSNDTRVGIPLIKQFALGGSGSLRGWGFQDLKIPDKTAVQGSASYVNYRTQFDFPVSPPLTFGPFLDAANLLVDDYSFGKLRFGTGFGLRYLTPVGPVNFDWGFKVQPRQGEDTNRFYFSIGVL